MISQSHKILRFDAANWVRFESENQLSTRIQANRDKFNTHGLTDNSDLNLVELVGSVHSLVKH